MGPKKPIISFTFRLEFEKKTIAIYEISTLEFFLFSKFVRELKFSNSYLGVLDTILEKLSSNLRSVHSNFWNCKFMVQK